MVFELSFSYTNDQKNKYTENINKLDQNGPDPFHGVGGQLNQSLSDLS